MLSLRIKPFYINPTPNPSLSCLPLSLERVQLGVDAVVTDVEVARAAAAVEAVRGERLAAQVAVEQEHLAHGIHVARQPVGTHERVRAAALGEKKEGRGRSIRSRCDLRVREAPALRSSCR